MQRMAKQVLYLLFFPLPFLPGRHVGKGVGRCALLIGMGWHVELTDA